MNRVRRSFSDGWRAGARLWPVVLIAYLVDTTFALVMAIPPTSALSAVFGHSALARELSGPVSLDWLIELQEGVDFAAFPWLLYLLVPLASLVVTTFLRGGILGALSREDSAALSKTAFLRDCVRYFWRLLILPIIIVPVFIVILVISLLTLRIGLTPGSGGLELASAIVRGILLALLAFLLPTILDYARVSLVLSPSRSIFRHLGRGIGFTVVRFPQVLPLGIAFWMAAALVAASVPAVLDISPLFAGFWTAFLVQQASAILASWQRVAMLGGELALFSAYRSTTPRRPDTNKSEGVREGRSA